MVAERLEQMMEGMVDGVFRKAFKTRIQPVEIARQLTREAEDKKIISLSRVYVPNHYFVGLAPEEMSALEAFAPEIQAELQRFMSEWIAERDYALSGPIRVELRPVERTPKGRVRVTSDSHTAPTAVDDAPTGMRERVALDDAVGRLEGVEGPDSQRRFPLFAARMVLGRATDCEIQLRDPLTSRHHAVVEPREGQWWVQDLDSTNGTLLNGNEVTESVLKDGDTLQFGESILSVRLWETE